jgi:hypothetical protein
MYSFKRDWGHVMDPSTLGTGSIVLNKISAMVNLLSGRSPVPAGCAQGGCVTKGGVGQVVDPVAQYLMVKWSPPNSGPVDFPLQLMYKSDAPLLNTEFGQKWYINYYRNVETGVPAGIQVNAAPNIFQYSAQSGSTPPYTPIAPNINQLTGSPTSGWIETQPDGNSFAYDTNGTLRSIRNPAGLRWTVSWDAGFNKVVHFDGPYGRRTTFAYDVNNRSAGFRIRAAGSPRSRSTPTAIWYESRRRNSA